MKKPNWKKEKVEIIATISIGSMNPISMDLLKIMADKIIKYAFKPALAKQKKELLNEVKDGLDNKVVVHSKFNFCKSCVKKMKWDFTMYDDKSLDKFLKELK